MTYSCFTNAVPRPKYTLTQKTHSVKDTRFLRGKILEILFQKFDKPLLILILKVLGPLHFGCFYNTYEAEHDE